ncbi:hypothetical protein F2Q70_00032481 [Brassica cretica]|uniref:Small monomeric GTPase n=1 Tax=Brassica cretica TaxID=69181 RepID=A0A8S9FRI4_BRACR|nr:hypothetical protein F2Q70_00032481 [Brassica cretica]KAF3591508.1 hypothetical protein DY000_02026266 [Brassica cretica]
MFVGNKADLRHLRARERERERERESTFFMETSALEATNVVKRLTMEMIPCD